MTELSPPRRRSSDRVVLHSVATLVGWYALVVLLFAVHVMTRPTRRTDDLCEVSSWNCWTNPRDESLFLGTLFGAPFLAASLAISIITLAVAVRSGARSGVAAGTLAALTGGIVIAVAACLLGAAVF